MTHGQLSFESCGSEIKSVKSTQKITRAYELIATSRIAKAQQRMAAARPYAEEITRVLTALATASTPGPPAAGGRGRSRSGPGCSW